MPSIFQTYYNKRRRKRVHKYLRGTGHAVGRGIVSAYTGALPSFLMAEAKRFVTAFVGTGLSSVGVDFHRIVLTTIPRNISGVTENSDNRVGRKIFVKGVTAHYMARTTTSNTQPVSMRTLLVWQKDPSENLLTGLTSAQYWSPIGATRAVKVLYDKYISLVGPSGTNGSPSRIISFYRKVNKMTKYDGSTTDGLDISTGALVMYFAIDPARNSVTSIFVDGNSTLSYKETQ